MLYKHNLVLTVCRYTYSRENTNQKSWLKWTSVNCCILLMNINFAFGFQFHQQTTLKFQSRTLSSGPRLFYQSLGGGVYNLEYIYAQPQTNSMEAYTKKAD